MHALYGALQPLPVATRRASLIGKTRFGMNIENAPGEENTSMVRIVPLSVPACLAG